MDSPQWSAMGALVADLSKAVAGLDDTQRRMREITGVAWSDDRTVKVVVGPRGQLVDIEIDPRVFRTPNSKALSAAILGAVERAVADATRQAKDLLEDALPQDLRGPRSELSDLAAFTSDVELRRRATSETGEGRNG